MSKILTNRTDNDIKNKWYAMKRKGERLGIDVRSDSYMESSVMNRTDDSVVNENKTTNNLFQSRHWGSRKVFH